MLAKWAPTEGGGPAAAGERGAGAGGGSLLLPRDVIHLTFVRSNFRSSSIALVLHRQVVPEFIIDMLLDSNVASTFGDDRGPGTAPPVRPVGLPLVPPERGPAQ